VRADQLRSLGVVAGVFLGAACRAGRGDEVPVGAGSASASVAWVSRSAMRWFSVRAASRSLSARSARMRSASRVSSRAVMRALVAVVQSPHRRSGATNSGWGSLRWYERSFRRCRRTWPRTDDASKATYGEQPQSFGGKRAPEAARQCYLVVLDNGRHADMGVCRDFLGFSTYRVVWAGWGEERLQDARTADTARGEPRWLGSRWVQHSTCWAG
jgi:hypothetical protein